jgi:tetratricopeptide (TPR) repeat protein
LLRLTSGPQDPKLSLALNNYGVNLFWPRRCKDAARVHEEALDLRRKLDPPDPAAVADSLHNLADAYRYTDPRNKDIKRLYEEALDIKSSLAHPDNVSIAQTRQNLASMQENLGQLGDAANNLEQALKAYRHELKADDPRIASVLNRQGILLFRQGDYKTAEGKFDEALRLERSSGKAQQITLRRLTISR